jgi:ADP-ribose pyrophosphatase YjhB (NUDIX family)
MFLETLLKAALLFAHWISQRATVGAVAVLTRADDVLLLRSSYRRGWHLPGGYLNPPETFEEGVRRETHEEIGYELGDVRLVDIIGGNTDRLGGRNYVAVFTSSASQLLISREMLSWEVREARWFPADDLPAEATDFTRSCIKCVLDDTARPSGGY